MILYLMMTHILTRTMNVIVRSSVVMMNLIIQVLKEVKLVTSTPSRDTFTLPKIDRVSRPKGLFHNLSLIDNLSESDNDFEANNLNLDEEVSEDDDNIVRELPQPPNEWNPLDLVFNYYPFSPDNEEIDVNPDIIETMHDCTPIDFFYLFFNEEVISLLVTETNRYAQQCIHLIQHSLHTRFVKWVVCIWLMK